MNSVASAPQTPPRSPDELAAENLRLQSQFDALSRQLAWFKKQVFGAKYEKQPFEVPGQRPLFERQDAPTPKPPAEDQRMVKPISRAPAKSNGMTTASATPACELAWTCRWRSLSICLRDVSLLAGLLTDNPVPSAVLPAASTPPEGRHHAQPRHLDQPGEKSIRARHLSGEQKHQYRLEHSQPIVEGFFAWCRSQLDQGGLLPSDGLNAALRYVLNREDSLKVFPEDPAVAIDTDNLESAPRPIPSGRNYPWSSVMKKLWSQSFERLPGVGSSRTAVKNTSIRSSCSTRLSLKPRSRHRVINYRTTFRKTTHRNRRKHRSNAGSVASRVNWFAGVSNCSSPTKSRLGVLHQSQRRTELHSGPYRND